MRCVWYMSPGVRSPALPGIWSFSAFKSQMYAHMLVSEDPVLLQDCASSVTAEGPYDEGESTLESTIRLEVMIGSMVRPPLNQDIGNAGMTYGSTPMRCSLLDVISSELSTETTMGLFIIGAAESRTETGATELETDPLSTPRASIRSVKRKSLG